MWNVINILFSGVREVGIMSGQYEQKLNLSYSFSVCLQYQTSFISNQVIWNICRLGSCVAVLGRRMTEWLPWQSSA
jgi:hypothetical protein